MATGRVMRQAIATLWLLLVTVSPALCAQEADAQGDITMLETNTSQSAEGYFVLTWNIAGDGDTQPVIQQSLDPAFPMPTVFRINNAGSMTLTGLEDGLYHFRAGYDGNWSNVVQVSVQHHQLSRALFYFSIGAVLFLVLAATIIIGNRRVETVDG